LYINENVKNIDEGKEIAETLSKKFFNYGLSLESKSKSDEEVVSGVELSEEDRKELDRWFLGDERYKKVMGRLGSEYTQEDIEKERIRQFKGYFKALSRKGYSESINDEEVYEEDNVLKQFVQRIKQGIGYGKSQELLLPSQGPIKSVHESIEMGIKSAIEMPRRDFEESISDRAKNTIKEVELPTGDFFEESLKVYESLDLPRLKKELEFVKETRDLAIISEKELEIAKLVHKEVSKFPYEKYIDTPTEIKTEKRLSCVGASVLGGTILEEIGINYFVVDIPEHSATILVTSDGKIYWQDFLMEKDDEGYYKEITPDIVEDYNSLRVFLDNPDLRGEKVRISEWNPYKSFGTFKYSSTLEFYLYEGGVGKNMQIIHNLSMSARRNGDYELGISIAKQLVRLNPYSLRSYLVLGDLYEKLGTYVQAERVYQKAIKVNPKDTWGYKFLALFYERLNKPEKEIETYKKAIQQDDKDPTLYYVLGATLEEIKHKREAAEAYKKILLLEDVHEELFKEAVNKVIALRGRI
jgi:tetratricopeptide (TPR) repeat protein